MVAGLFLFAWVHSVAPGGGRVHSDSHGFTRAGKGVYWFNRVPWVHSACLWVVVFIRVLLGSHLLPTRDRRVHSGSSAFWRAIGSSGSFMFARVLWGRSSGRRVHSGSFGFPRVRLEVVVFIRVRVVHFCNP